MYEIGSRGCRRRTRITFDIPFASRVLAYCIILVHRVPCAERRRDAMTAGSLIARLRIPRTRVRRDGNETQSCFAASPPPRPTGRNRQRPFRPQTLRFPTAEIGRPVFPSVFFFVHNRGPPLPNNFMHATTPCTPFNLRDGSRDLNLQTVQRRRAGACRHRRKVVGNFFVRVPDGVQR